jgi:hypothetical protein
MEWTNSISKAKLYEMAEWAVTALALMFGWRYLKQIIAWVLMEMHRLLIQRGFLPID